MKIHMGHDEVAVEALATGQVWFHTERGPGLGQISREVSVEDVMALVHHLTQRMPVFSNETFDNVRLDIRTYEAKKEGEETFRKIQELGVKYLGVDAAHLKQGERELIERLLAAEEGR